jgi:hypothetical protein
MQRLFILAVLPLLVLASACSQASATEPETSVLGKSVVARRPQAW